MTSDMFGIESGFSQHMVEIAYRASSAPFHIITEIPMKSFSRDHRTFKFNGCAWLDHNDVVDGFQDRYPPFIYDDEKIVNQKHTNCNRK